MANLQQQRVQREQDGLLPLTLKLSKKNFEVNRLYYKYVCMNTEQCLDKWGHQVYDDITWVEDELRDKWIDVQVDEGDAFWHK